MQGFEQGKIEFGRKLDAMQKNWQEQNQAMSSAMDWESMAAAWNQRLKEQLDEYQHSKPVLAAPSLAGKDIFVTITSQIDSLFFNEAGLRRVPCPPGFAQPVKWFEDEKGLRYAMQEAGYGSLFINQPLPGMIHVPGKGTFAQKAYYLNKYNLSSTNSQTEAAGLIREWVSERWGWGFLLEYSGMGQGLGKAGFWPSLLKDHFFPPLGDSRVKIINQSWLFTRAGWQIWAWQYVMFKSQNNFVSAPYNLKTQNPYNEKWFLELFSRFLANLSPTIHVYGIPVQPFEVLRLLKFLIVDPLIGLPLGVDSIVTRLQMGLSDIILQKEDSGSELGNFLGQVLLARVEMNVGVTLVPFAVLLAANLPDTAARANASPEEFARNLGEQNILNPDIRLLQLSALSDPVKYQLDSLISAAWDKLGMVTPEELKPVYKNGSNR